VLHCAAHCTAVGRRNVITPHPMQAEAACAFSRSCTPSSRCSLALALHLAMAHLPQPTSHDGCPAHRHTFYHSNDLPVIQCLIAGMVCMLPWHPTGSTYGPVNNCCLSTQLPATPEPSAQSGTPALTTLAVRLDLTLPPSALWPEHPRSHHSQLPGVLALLLPLTLPELAVAPGPTAARPTVCHAAAPAASTNTATSADVSASIGPTHSLYLLPVLLLARSCCCWEGRLLFHGMSKWSPVPHESCQVSAQTCCTTQLGAGCTCGWSSTARAAVRAPACASRCFEEHDKHKWGRRHCHSTWL
jgi:hypothetical protein